MFSPCLRGFSPGTRSSSPDQRHVYEVREIGFYKLTLWECEHKWLFVYVSPAMGWLFVQDAPCILPKGRWESLTAGFFLIVVSGVENEEDKEEEIPEKHPRSKIFLSQVTFHGLACREPCLLRDWWSMGDGHPWVNCRGVEGVLWIL